MNAKITFVELVDLIAEATSTSKRMCELFLREFFNTVSQALVDGENVKIKGIGTFKVTQVKSRKASSTDNDEESGMRSRLTFTPDKSLAEALNQPFAQFETVFLDDAVTDEKLDEIDRLYPSYFPETGDLPEPPDYPQPPIPNADEIPALTPETAPKQKPKKTTEALKPEPKPEPELEPKPEPEPTTKPEPEPEPKPEPEPATKPEPKPKPKPETKPKPEPKPEPEPATKPEPEPEPVSEPVAKKKEVKPLMGIPIDGPSTQPAMAKPIPAPTPAPVEEEEEDYFYRPAPRNIYSPTKEQIETQQSSGNNKRWLWIALAVLATGLLIWGITRCNSGKADNQDLNETAMIAAVDSDSIATARAEAEEKDKAEIEAKVKAEAEAKAKAEAEAEAKAKAEAEAKAKAEAEAKAKAEQEAKMKSKAAEEAKSANKNSRVVTDVVTDQIVLVTLAEKHYGSPWFWVYIYEENRDKISNPNNIKPGTRVVIPPAEKYGINAKNPESLKKARRKSWEYLKKYQ